LIATISIGRKSMPNQSIATLRQQALELPEADRAELARDLVASLDGPADTDVADAWDKEILRRLAEIDAGTAELIDRDELTRRLQQRPQRA
jgi:putative addiction module component (TIGR02574 family)